MSYNFSSFKTDLALVPEHFAKELSSIQTGRATLAFFDGIRIESYGSQMPINQVAGMTVEDARTVRIAPWDRNTVAAVEKALRESGLGVSVVTDDKGIRAIFPDLTTETRERYVKMVGKKLEEARIAVRTLRENVWSDIQKKHKDSELSEDEKFSAKETMEGMVKEMNEKLEDMSSKKEKDIMSI